MRPRFEHLLVPVDFTAKNRAAVDIAFELAVQNKARTTLLHVIETIEYVPDEETAEFYRKLEERADGELDLISQRFETAHVNVACKIRYGKRAQEIVRYELDHDVDLIVMSSHRIDSEHPVQSLGTLSYQVAMLCQCPVLLVK